jgi:hypothetical protein
MSKVHVQVFTRELKCEFFNGLGFNLDSVNFATELKGHVGERVQYVTRIHISLGIDIKDFRLANSDTLIRPAGSFINDGFTVGGNIRLIGLVDPIFNDFTAKVKSISNTQLVFENPDNLVVNGTIERGSLRDFTPQTALINRFGIIENSSPFSSTSLVDQSEQQYYSGEIGLGPIRNVGFVDMEWLGTIKGMKTGNMKARYVENVLDVDEFAADEYVQVFEIVHEFVINPYYRDGNIANIEDEVPPADTLAGSKSLKYVFNAEFRNSLNSPSTAKSVTDEKQLGSVGYYGESFNGFLSKYEATDVEYLDVQDSIETENLNINKITRVSGSFISEDGNFTVNSQVVVYHKYLPDADNYQDQKNEFKDVWIFESCRAQPSVTESRGIIRRLRTTFIDANQIDFEFEIDFSFSNTAQTILEDGFEYVLDATVGTVGVTVNQSDKTLIKIDKNVYVKDGDIPGLLTYEDLQCYLHNQDHTVDTGVDGYKGWIEDGILIKTRFKTHRDLSAIIDSVKIQLAAVKISTPAQFFALQTIIIPSSDIVLKIDGADSYQVIDLETTRGLNLTDDDPFNLLSFKFIGFNDITKEATYEVFCGLKINWQEWIQQADADTIFLDTNNEFFKGLNKKASNYSLKEGYAIRVQALVEVSQNNIPTDYINQSDDYEIHNYEEDGKTPIEWACVIELYDELDNAFLEDNIIVEGRNTIIRARFTPDAGGTPIPSAFYGIIRIEAFEQPGEDIYELSSLAFRPAPDDNLIIPLDGETTTIIYEDSGDIVLECRSDGSKLKTKYAASARLFSASPFVQVFKYDTNHSLVTRAGLDDYEASLVGGTGTYWQLKQGSQFPGLSQTITDGDQQLGELDGSIQKIRIFDDDYNGWTELNIDDTHGLNVLADTILTPNLLTLFANNNSFTGVNTGFFQKDNALIELRNQGWDNTQLNAFLDALIATNAGATNTGRIVSLVYMPNAKGDAATRTKVSDLFTNFNITVEISQFIPEAIFKRITLEV